MLSIRRSKINKLDRVLSIISKAISEILNHNNDFTGSITLNFCLGGITSIQKKENVKV